MGGLIPLSQNIAPHTETSFLFILVYVSSRKCKNGVAIQASGTYFQVSPLETILPITDHEDEHQSRNEISVR